MKAVKEAGEELPPEVREMGEVGVWWIWVFRDTSKKIFTGFVDDGDVYVA